jgi:hypothetical protein
MPALPEGFACGPLLATFTVDVVDQGPPPSWHGWLHFAGFLIVSLIPIVALPIIGSAVWSDPRWQGLGPLSVAWGAVLAVVVFLPGSPADGYALWSGPGSMADIALVGTWQIVASQRLRRLAWPLPYQVGAQPAKLGRSDWRRIHVCSAASLTARWR